MTDTELEKGLQGFDYSLLSRVRESLLAELLQAHEKNRGRNFSAEIMTDEDLEFVSAAGNQTEYSSKRSKDLLGKNQIKD